MATTDNTLSRGIAALASFGVGTSSDQDVPDPRSFMNHRAILEVGDDILFGCPHMVRDFFGEFEIFVLLAEKSRDMRATRYFVCSERLFDPVSEGCESPKYSLALTSQINGEEPFLCLRRSHLWNLLRDDLRKQVEQEPAEPIRREIIID